MKPSGTLSALACALLALLFLHAAPAVAQEGGSITGVVVDGETGEPLIGANAVLLPGGTTGGTTDIDGRYEITDLEAVSYDVKFSYVGYQGKTVQGVEVTAGAAATLDVSLAPEAVDLEEVTVTAEVARNSEAALLRDRQKASAVSDAISAEAISRAGSSNAASAMEKVTGAAVEGGKYVVIRGMGDRYTNTQLNGVDLPSADPDRNSVQFDLFPANLLDNIVTLKTFTPDKPGSFSGGLVDINTKSFPRVLDLRFSASSSVNTQVHFRDDYLTYPGGDLDFLGIDDGTREMPSALKGVQPNQIPDVVSASRDRTLALRLDQFSKSFNNVMAPIQGTAPVDQSYALSLGNKSEVLGNQFGYIASLTYSRNSSFYENGRTERYSFNSLDAEGLSPDLLLSDTEGTEEASIGGLANFTYRLGANNEIGVNTLYTRSGESTARLQRGTWPKEFGAGDTTNTFAGRTLTYAERELYSGKLRGEHFLEGVLESTVKWSASYSDTKQQEPDTRFFASVSSIRNGGRQFNVEAAGFDPPSRHFRNLSEQSYGGDLDVSVPFTPWAGRQAQLKVGGSYKADARDFEERVFSIQPERIFEGNEETYFSNENMGIVRVDTSSSGNLTYQFGNYLRDNSKPENNYNGDREIAAGYAMVELPITERFRAIGGARLETTYLDVQSEVASVDEAKIDEVDILPSLNFVYEARDDMNVRAALTRTLARPTFREIAPFARFDFILGNFQIGNPSLQRSLITNADLRWEWFTRPGELLAASVFYKDLQDPIEQVLIPTTNGQRTWQNVDRATVYGAEFEIRSGLDFMASALEHFSIGANLSLTQSSVDISEEELRRRRNLDPDAESTRPLQGQSPYLFNADLSYENPNSGTTAGLFFDVFGNRLAEVGLYPVPDVYEQSRPGLDFTFGQRLYSGVRVKVSAKNILNSAFEQVYTFNNQEFTYQRYELGRSFSVGVTYSP